MSPPGAWVLEPVVFINLDESPLEGRLGEGQGVHVAQNALLRIVASVDIHGVVVDDGGVVTPGLDVLSFDFVLDPPVINH